MLFVGQLIGQTTVITYHQDAGNPNGLNTTTDATTSGWKDILDDNLSAPAWGEVDTIPFPFTFNGVNEQYFKVSSNGILTFDTAAAGPYGGNNEALPSANIPDRSILAFWDVFTTTNANDRAVSNTFGTAPNRQHWVKYYSTAWGPDGDYNYLAIVFEEGTNVIYIVDMYNDSDLQDDSTTVGLQFNGSLAVSVGDTIGLAGNGSSNSDNDYYQFITYPAGTCIPPSQLGVQNITASSADISFTSYNTGATPVAQYGPAGFTPGTGTSVVGSGSLVLLSGLSGNTSYDVFVKDSCSASSVSAWTGPINFRTNCSSSLSGSYTVNGSLAPSSTNFQTLSSLAATLNNCGISGPVNVSIASGTYNEPLILDQVLGASSSNPIVIDGVDSSQVVISFGSANDTPVVWLNGTDWVTIKNLTIENTYSSSDAWGIMLSNKADHNTIDGVQVKLEPKSTSDRSPILTSSSTSSVSGGDNGNHLSVKNSRLVGGYYGLVFRGTSTQHSYDVTIDNVIFEEQYYRGAWFDYADSVSVTDNTFPKSSSTSTLYYSLYLNDVDQIEVSGNNIISPERGIYLYDVNQSLPTNALSRVFNNIVLAEGSYAVYSYDNKKVGFYHNTFMGDDGMYINDQDTMEIVNNVLYGYTYALYSSDSFDPVADVVDYNLYESEGTNLAYESGTEVDLATWQTNNANQNANSIVDPIAFVASDDLHILNNAGNDAGNLIPGITVDIDGETRPWTGSTMVDLGADERALNPCEPILVYGAYALSDTSAAFWWEGPSTATNWDVEYGPSGFTPGIGLGTLVSSSNDTLIVNGLTEKTTYDFYVTANCGASSTGQAGPGSVITLPGFVTVPYFNDFDQMNPLDDFLLTGNVDAAAYLDTIGTCNGSQGIRMTGGSFSNWTGGSTTTDSVDAWVTNNLHHAYSMINVDATNANALFMRLEFKLKQESNYGPGYSWFRVLINDTVISKNYNPTTLSSDPCKKVSLDISQYLGRSFKIELQTSNKYDDDISVIDDFSIRLLSCNVPSSLGATNISSTEADLFWTPGGASDFIVEWGPKGFQPGTGNRFAATNDTVSISGLNIATEYDFYVQDSCSATDVSPQVGPFTFKTAYEPYYVNGFDPYPGLDWEEAEGLFSQQPITYGSSLWSQDEFGNVSTNSQSANVNIYSTTRDEWIVSPLITLDTVDYALEYDVAFTDWPNTTPGIWGPDDTVHVVVSTDGGRTWPRANIIKTYSSASHPTNTGSREVLPLLQFKNQTIRIGFYAESTVSNEDTDFFIDSVEIKTAPSCFPPQDLTVDTATFNGLGVTWTGSAANYIVEWGTCGYIQGTGAGKIGVDTVAANSYLITGLNSNTCYDIYVQALCGPNDASILQMVSGNTLCGIEALPYQESFDGPSWSTSTTYDQCWEISSTSYKFQVDNNSTSSSNTGPTQDHSGFGNYIYTEASSGSSGDEATATSKWVDLSTAANPRVSFWYHFYGSDIDRMFVDVFDGTTWTDSVSAIIGAQQDSSEAAWKRWSVDLAAFANDTVKIRFRGRRGGSYEGDMSIDDIEVYDSIPCPAPSALQFTNLACDSAQIEWTAGGFATNTFIEYGPNGFTRGTGTLLSSVSSPVVINGLTPGTDYDVYVIDSCSGVIESLVMDTLTTPTGPLPSISYTTNQVSTNASSARVAFDASATTDGTSFTWDFGNGNTANGDTASFVYNANGTYSVTLTVTNGCGTVDSTFNVEVKYINIEENSLPGVSMYPNPTSGEVTIVFPGGTREIQVFDLQGRELFRISTDANSTQERIDLSGLAAGVYMVRIKADQGESIQRLILE
ncbi:MAG: PKD domain-containing protein [Bacteroidota bacterium]|nr:PKD domain-containing protein [Bacteroidota bacterium]